MSESMLITFSLILSIGWSLFLALVIYRCATYLFKPRDDSNMFRAGLVLLAAIGACLLFLASPAVQLIYRSIL